MTNEDRRQTILKALREEYPSNIFDFVKVNEDIITITYSLYIFGELKELLTIYKVSSNQPLMSEEDWKIWARGFTIMKHLVII